MDFCSTSGRVAGTLPLCGRLHRPNAVRRSVPRVPARPQASRSSNPLTEEEPLSTNAALKRLVDATAAKKLIDYSEVAYLTGRTRVVTQRFPGALAVDDFMLRLEIALYAYGFNGDNSIGEQQGFFLLLMI
jgi:hypothetical protein